MRGAVAGAVLAAAVLVSCSPAVPETPVASVPDASADNGAPPDLRRYYDQRLDWQDCGQNLKCADLTVPLDYSDPDAGEVKLAVARHRSGDSPQRALVFNPGGPGGSGVEFAKVASYIVAPEVLEAYDFVGFDPRGVGASDPVECLTDAQLDKIIATDADPETPADVRALVADAERFSSACRENAARMLGHIDTASGVKDMDILRAALGQEKLNYLGKSYGTKLGALYAQQFGPRVGRMVLDGVLPADLTPAEVAHGQAVSFEESLRRYVAWCQSKSSCPVAAGSGDAGVARIQQFLRSLEDKPLRAGDRQFTQSMAMQSLLFHMYYPYAGDWEKLNQGLESAFAGDPSRLLDVLDERLERDASGHYKNSGNAYESFVAVTCSDGKGESDTGALSRRAQEWAQEAPTFGPIMAWTDLVCGVWPVQAQGEPTVVSAPDAPPILVVSTAHDPATPLAWARQLADRLPGAALVTWESDGHTAYYNGSSCVDEAVDRYLLDGELPDRETTCS